MKRRELIQSLALASAAAGTGILAYPLRALAEGCEPIPQMPRTLVNCMLNGGADLRFLFMPAPGSLDRKHEQLVFSSRRSLYASWRETSSLDYQGLFDLEYDLATDPLSGASIGILKRCGWLKDEFEAGRVAIVANAYCSRNRRHDQSILNANAGTPHADTLNFDVSGWGGRLVEVLGPDARVVEIGKSISVFGQGSLPGSRLQQVIHAQNTRDIALPDVVDGGAMGRRDVITRALKSYYAARGEEVASEQPGNWPFHAFFNHNKAFRSFGATMAARMADCGALPETLLPASAEGDFSLYSEAFAQQCRNLYDVCLAPDLLGARTISMNYGGWDTHHTEESRAGNNLEDIFGADKGLARASHSIAGLGTNALDNMLFYFASDFGRQLVANGDFGTDHGRGTYAILIGGGVRGGVYGDMFPAYEGQESDGRVPLEAHGADILGRTSTERILAAACNWIEPGAGQTVFPGAVTADIENPGLLDGVFAA